VALQIHKAGQGRYVRVGTAIGVVIINLVLGYYLWLLLDRHLSTDPSFAVYKTYLEYGLAAVLFMGLTLLAAYYLNKPNFVDFLIATESEMKKVSWSNRAELIGSTIVVIATVFVLAIIIFVVDFLFAGGLSTGWTIPGTGLHIPGLGLW
jgi:preprotein translocase subunit SecE